MSITTRLAASTVLLVGCISSDPSTGACTVDNFDAPAIDTQMWGIYEQPPTTIVQRDGKLMPMLADRAVAYASLYSIADLDFRGTSVAVEVTSAPNIVGAEVLLQWVVNNRYRHFISAEAGRLYVGTQNDTEYRTRDIPYDPVAQRHWRLRHDDDRHVVVYETSPDRTKWVVEREDAVLIPLQEAYVEIAGGTYTEVANPGEVAFDNYELAGRCAP